MSSPTGTSANGRSVPSGSAIASARSRAASAARGRARVDERQELGHGLRRTSVGELERGRGDPDLVPVPLVLTHRVEGRAYGGRLAQPPAGAEGPPAEGGWR